MWWMLGHTQIFASKDPLHVCLTFSHPPMEQSSNFGDSWNSRSWIRGLFEGGHLCSYQRKELYVLCENIRSQLIYVSVPVLVYFHGGGYVYGNPASWPFDHWVDQSPNVVIVSVYYRLSSFGFLALPALRDPTYGDLNAGFLDQIESLRWVKKNIAAFGGNPGRITINGQSAGGGSVQLHLVADLGGETLFHGAIAQSVYRAPVPSLDDQKVSIHYHLRLF